MAQLTKQLTCKQCSKEHAFEESHSTLVVLQHVGPNGYKYYQCDQGEPVDGHTWQHWNCSHDCMRSSLLECVEQHYSEALLHPPLSGTTNLHLQIAREHLACPVCQADIAEVGYRFCFTRATPINAVEDGTLHHLLGWCCSLDHAKIAASAYIDHAEEL